MKKNSLQSFLKDVSDCDVSHKSIFCNLTSDEIETFDKHKSCLLFKKGQQVFKEGAYPQGVFIIDSGKIKLEHSGDEGKMQIVRMAKAGDLLGYRALFCGEKYNATAVALEEANLCFIPKDIFFRVLDSNRHLSLDVIKILAKDLRNAEDHLTELAQKPVRERLAKALLSLNETYGVDHIQGTINVHLSREEIADLVGTATETAIRLLSDFRHEGIIELIGKKIKISDPDKLQKVAHYYRGEYLVH